MACDYVIAGDLQFRNLSDLVIEVNSIEDVNKCVNSSIKLIVHIIHTIPHNERNEPDLRWAKSIEDGVLTRRRHLLASSPISSLFHPCFHYQHIRPVHCDDSRLTFAL